MYIALFRYEALALYCLVCQYVLQGKRIMAIYIYFWALTRRETVGCSILYIFCVSNVVFANDAPVRFATMLQSKYFIAIKICFFAKRKREKKNCIYKSIRLYEPRSTGFSWTEIRDEILPCTKSQRVNAVSASILRYYMNKPCISSVNRNKYIGPPNLKSWWWP